MGTYVFTVEVDAAVQDVYVVRGSVRAYRQTANPLTVYVRTEDGPMDLSGVQTLEVAIPWRQSFSGYWDYGNATQGLYLTVPAYSPEAGRVMFTLTSDTLATLYGSSNTLYIRADGRVVYTALLEIID